MFSFRDLDGSHGIGVNVYYLSDTQEYFTPTTAALIMVRGNQDVNIWLLVTRRWDTDCQRSHVLMGLNFLVLTVNSMLVKYMYLLLCIMPTNEILSKNKNPFGNFYLSVLGYVRGTL